MKGFNDKKASDVASFEQLGGSRLMLMMARFGETCLLILSTKGLQTIAIKYKVC